MARDSHHHQDGQADQSNWRIARAVKKLLGISPNKTHDGNSPGAQDGNHDGGAHGVQNGAQHGPQNGAHDGANYDFRVVRSGDTFIELAPGEHRPADAEAHAQAFLVWLQGDAELTGWVRRSLLEKLYYGPFLEIMKEIANWPPESWHTVAHHFRKLPGVKRRQKDHRKGVDRVGPSPTDYWIPDPDAAVVELAEEKRKRA